MEIYGVCCFHRGYKKDKNEDNFFFDHKTLETMEAECGTLTAKIRKDCDCFAVFDGMGGFPDGEIAASMAAELLQEEWDKGAGDERKIWAEEVLWKIHRSIAAYSRDHECQIGTTGAILVVEENSCIIANVGDSRVYRLNGHKMEQLSEDHSDRKLLEELNIKGRNPSLLQFIGNKAENSTMTPAVSVVRHKKRGRYLLCSDGLTDMVQDWEIEKICNETKDPEACAKRLVEQAMEHGGEDNITVIVVDLCREAGLVWSKIGTRIKKTVNKLQG